MATEVLRPHDVLRGPFPAVLQAPRRRTNTNPKAYRKATAPTPVPRPEAGRRQRERSPKPASAVGDGGQVAILKRGGERIRRPDEKVYAGSGFSNSPAPSALPLPSSLVVVKRGDDAAAQAAATMTLRRMLGLY